MSDSAENIVVHRTQTILKCSQEAALAVKQPISPVDNGTLPPSTYADRSLFPSKYFCSGTSWLVFLRMVRVCVQVSLAGGWLLSAGVGIHGYNASSSTLATLYTLLYSSGHKGSGPRYRNRTKIGG
jgi:hypothetical protein